MKQTLGDKDIDMDRRGYTIDSKKLEYGPAIYAGVPSSLGYGVGGSHIPIFWLLPFLPRGSRYPSIVEVGLKSGTIDLVPKPYYFLHKKVPEPGNCMSDLN